MNRSYFILVICSIIGISNSQKCSIVLEKQNVSQSMLCQNINSMNDIADEIKNTQPWQTVKIVNKAQITEFTNNAGNLIPYRL